MTAASRAHWIAAFGARAAARVDWGAWRRMPARLSRQVRAIERHAGSVIVAYPRRHGARPATSVPPCRLLPGAAMTAASVARLGALERGSGGRWILVAYRAPSPSRRR